MGAQWGSLKDNKREKIDKEKKKKEEKKEKKIYMPVYLGISPELLQPVQVQFNFRQLLFPAYTS